MPFGFDALSMAINNHAVEKRPQEMESGPPLALPSSFLAQVTGVFFQPVRTFADAARRPRFLAPFLTTMMVFAGFWGAVYLKLGLSGMAVAVVQYFRRGTLVTQDEIDFTLQFAHALAPAIVIGGAVVILVHLLIIAWVGARILVQVFGVKLRLRVALGLACYAYLAKTLAQTVLSIPVVIFGDLNGLNFSNLLPTNIAFFLDPKDTSRILYVFLQSLDLVQLWYFTLLGIGFSMDSDDRAASGVTAGSLAILWIGWNVLFAAFRDVLMGH